MARGKHSSAAALRRAEAAHEHIDRLTDQLVEAKARAREHEHAANRLPSVEKALAAAVQDRDSGTSPRIKELEAQVYRLQKERNAALEKFRVGQGRWESALEALVDCSNDFPLEVLEKIMKAMHGVAQDEEFTCSMGVSESSAKKLGVEAVRKIQQARGIRK